MTIKALAEKVRKISGKKVSADSISRKLNSGTMKYDEAKFYADILGYDLGFTRRK